MILPGTLSLQSASSIFPRSNFVGESISYYVEFRREAIVLSPSARARCRQVITSTNFTSKGTKNDTIVEQSILG